MTSTTTNKNYTMTTMAKMNNKSSSFLNAVMEAKMATINEGILPFGVARTLGVHRQPTTQLKETYVLCERGGANLQRQANCQYRNIVYRYRPKFFQTETNAEKKSITLEAQQEVKDAGLELVREFRGGIDDQKLGVVDHYPFLHGCGYYYFLDGKRVYSKIIQLIRDGNPEVIQNRMKKNKKCSSSGGGSKLSLVKILSHKNKKQSKHKATLRSPSKSKKKKIQSRISIHHQQNKPNNKAKTDMRAARTFSSVAGGSLLGNKQVTTTPVSPSRPAKKQSAPVGGRNGMISPQDRKRPPSSVTTTTTPEDEREMWIFWNLLSRNEHKEIAQQHGHPTIGGYEEQLSFQITATSMDWTDHEDYSFGAVAALPAIATATLEPPTAAAGPARKGPTTMIQQSTIASEEIDATGLDDIPLDDLSTSSFLEGLDDLEMMLDFSMDDYEDKEDIEQEMKHQVQDMLESKNPPPVSCIALSSTCCSSSSALQHLDALDGGGGYNKEESFHQSFYPVSSTASSSSAGTTITETMRTPLPLEKEASAISFPRINDDYHHFSAVDAPVVDDDTFVQGLLVA